MKGILRQTRSGLSGENSVVYGAPWDGRGTCSRDPAVQEMRMNGVELTLQSIPGPIDEVGNRNNEKHAIAVFNCVTDRFRQ